METDINTLNNLTNVSISIYINIFKETGLLSQHFKCTKNITYDSYFQIIQFKYIFK